jgi:hypothetical protein
MGRTPAAVSGTETTETREPEVMRSADLAEIVTLELIDMIGEAVTRYETAHLGRKMAPILSACRGLVRDVRAVHGLRAIDWRTGLPVGETVSDNGAEPAPEAAEVAS